MFRKGATHKLKPSPSDITAIGLSNSVIGLRDHHLTQIQVIPEIFKISWSLEVLGYSIFSDFYNVFLLDLNLMKCLWILMKLLSNYHNLLGSDLGG